MVSHVAMAFDDLHMLIIRCPSTGQMTSTTVAVHLCHRMVCLKMWLTECVELRKLFDISIEIIALEILIWRSLNLPWRVLPASPMMISTTSSHSLTLTVLGACMSVSLSTSNFLSFRCQVIFLRLLSSQATASYLIFLFIFLTFFFLMSTYLPI